MVELCFPWLRKRLTLAELWSATGGFETVLILSEGLQSIVFTGLFGNHPIFPPHFCNLDFFHHLKRHPFQCSKQCSQHPITLLAYYTSP